MSQPQSAEMPVRVRVLRLEPGQSALVLCLSPGSGPDSDRVGGTFGHHFKGAWHPCVKGQCPAAMHATDEFWRGYLAAYHDDKALKRWVPCVLEVSESLELDMRGRYAPQQLWEISRAKAKGGRRPPYVGRLWHQQGKLERVAAFNVLPILEAFYHASPLDIAQVSKQPDRVYLAMRQLQGEAAHVDGTPVTDRATPEQIAKLHKRLGSFANGIGGVS